MGEVNMIKRIKHYILRKIYQNEKWLKIWNKVYYMSRRYTRRYDRTKSIILSSCLLVIIITIGVLTTSHHRYNGKFINEISENDKICKMLLEDIHDFKAKYDGKGGGSSNTDLQVVMYRIKEGDSLWQISQKTGLNMDTLLSMNSMDNVHLLQPNQTISIPNKDGILHKVIDGQTLEDIAEKYGVDKSDILDVNDLSASSLEAGKDVFVPNGTFKIEERVNLLGRFILPVLGRISSGFGPRRNPLSGRKEYHHGIDLANVTGTRVKAADYGRVIFRGRRGGYGKLIIVKHSCGYSTRYGHLSRYAVKHGQKVRQGQTIGYVGSTGHVTGPHCHFEIRKYGRPLNPYFLMRFSQK